MIVFQSPQEYFLVTVFSIALSAMYFTRQDREIHMLFKSYFWSVSVFTTPCLNVNCLTELTSRSCAQALTLDNILSVMYKKVCRMHCHHHPTSVTIHCRVCRKSATATGDKVKLLSVANLESLIIGCMHIIGRSELRLKSTRRGIGIKKE